jgi:uncharacterized coiled-coil DUF342 family protein
MVTVALYMQRLVLSVRRLIRLCNIPRYGEGAGMGQASEYEHRKKLNRIREDTNKRVNDVRDHFAKIEKVKTEALKKTEEIRRSAEKDMKKLEEEIAKSDLTAEVKKTLISDIALLRKEIEDRANELRTRLTAIAVPP